MAVQNVPKCREFSGSVDAAAALQDYFNAIIRTHSFHDIPVVHPGPREAFATDKMHISDIASSCARLPVLSALVPHDPDEGQEPNGYFISGHLHESFVVGCLNAGHPGEFDTQLELDNIPEEIQSHTDVYWSNRNLVIEIKSIGISARGTSFYPRDSALRQAAAYSYFIGHKTGETPAAVVVYIFREDPSLIDVFPVPEHLVLEMAMRVEESVSNYRSRSVPSVPSDFKPDRFPCSFRDRGGKVHACRMYSYCWADHKDPAPLSLDDSSLKKVANQLVNIQKQLSDLNSRTDELKRKRSELEAMLAGPFSVNPVLGTDDPEFDIKRIVVRDKIDYDYNLLVRKGLIPMDVLAQAERRKSGYSYSMLVKKKKEE